MAVSQKGPELLVLVAGDVIHACGKCCVPALLDCSEGAEIVAMEPSIATEFLFRSAIESVEANPQALLMRVRDE